MDKVTCMEIYEDNGPTKTCLSLTFLGLRVVGEPQEKWMSLAIMLHAYLV